MKTSSHRPKRSKKDIKWHLWTAGFGLSIFIIHFLLLFLFPKLGINLSYITERTWGYHFIKFFPSPVIFLYYILFLVIVLFPLKMSDLNDIQNNLNRTLQKIWDKYKILILPSLLIFGLLLFWLFRVKYPFLGDGVLRIQGSVLKKGRTTLGLYHYSYKLISQFTPISGATSMAITHIFLGIWYLTISFFLSWSLGKTPVQKLMTFISIVTCGIILIFFGYFEIYGFAAVFLLLYFYLGLLSLRNKCPVTLVGVVLLIAYLIHPLNIIFAPSLLYLIYEKHKLRFAFLRKKSFFVISGISGIIIGIAFFNRFSSSMLRFFPTETYQNGMLTFQHLIEFLNSQILAAPAAFLALGFLLFIFLKKREKLNSVIIYFGIAGIFGLFFAFTANVLKGSADWDILSFPGIPVTLFALSIFFQLSNNILPAKAAFQIITLFSATALFNTIPWVIVNSTDMSAERFEEILLNDPGDSYIGDYHSAENYAGSLLKEYGFVDKALKLAKLDLEKRPHDPRSHYNLALDYFDFGKYQESKDILINLKEIDQYYPLTYFLSAEIAIIEKDTPSIKTYIETLSSLYSKHIETRNYVAKVGNNPQLYLLRKKVCSIYYKEKDYENLTRHLAWLTNVNKDTEIDGKTSATIVNEIKSKINYHPEIFTHIADIYLALQNPRLANDFIIQVNTKSPNYFPQYKVLHKFYNTIGDINELKRLLNYLISLFDKNKDSKALENSFSRDEQAFYRMHFALFLLKNDKNKAIEQYKIAEQLSPVMTFQGLTARQHLANVK